MGHYSRATVVSGPGIWLGDDAGAPTPEEIAANWKEVTTLKGAQNYRDANAALMAMLTGPKETPEGEEEKAERGETPPRDTPVDVQRVFDNLPSAFQPEAAAGVDVVFQFSISGPGGGDWYAAITDGACTVEAGAHDKPTTTLKMSDNDFLAYVGGRLPAMQAYSTGKLRIEGDLMKSQLVEKLFKFQSGGQP
jgi:putative sterol carrier protein